MKTLFERIGGDAAVLATVNELHCRLRTDTRLAPLFAGIEADHLQQHQRHFLALAMGGPNAYTGRELGRAHRGLVKRQGLCDGDFDRMLQHLDDSLAAVGVAAPLRAETRSLANRMRDAVLGRAAARG